MSKRWVVVSVAVTIAAAVGVWHLRLVTPRFYLGAIARAEGDYAEAAAQYQALTKTSRGVAAGYLGQAEAQVMLRNAPEAFRILSRGRWCLEAAARLIT